MSQIKETPFSHWSLVYKYEYKQNYKGKIKKGKRLKKNTDSFSFCSFLLVAVGGFSNAIYDIQDIWNAF